MFLALKEKHFAKRALKRLLKSYSAVAADRPELSGKPLYREVLLNSRLVDASRVDHVLRQAEESVDDWTAGAERGLGFREVAHFVLMSEYLRAGHAGTVVSFREIAYKLIPEEL